ncbi:MAG: NUDIX domain-containing protein [Gammaproteobacteria bacterium]|nr:NUDIX domain-containing protein [Gammaproteobacteria bacterium]
MIKMSKLTTFDKSDLTVISRKTQWQGYFKILKYRFTHQLFKGGESKVIEREMFERGHAVVVIPYDPVNDCVVMIEQIRVGTFDHNMNPWLVELVAGVIDEGETSLAVAHRELLEETGLQAVDCYKVLEFLSSPGGMSEQIELFIAQIDSANIENFAGLAEEGEDIRVFVMSREAAMQAVDQGDICNGASIIGIQWLALNYQRLQQWQQNE